MTLLVDVEKRLGDTRIAACFESAGGGITALFGRSGAGKTAIVDMIAGLLRPDRGRIVAGDRVLFDSAAGIDLPAERRRVGYVFQEARLFPHMSVRRNLTYGRRFAPPAERQIGFDQVVALLGLGGLLARRPRTLSGGEKQRVAIGRALLACPRLLLMDEPLASLDAARKSEILPYIERLPEELGLPIVYVSHALEEVDRLAETVVVISDGHVAAAGSVETVMSRLDLRPLIGRYEAGALIETRVEAHDDRYGLTLLRFAGGLLHVSRIDRPAGAPVRARIRARDVSLALQRPENISILNVFAGRVVDIVGGEGAIKDLRIELGKAGETVSIGARITARSVGQLGLTRGSAVYALIKTVALDRRSLGLREARARR